MRRYKCLDTHSIDVIYVQVAALSGNVIYWNPMCSTVGDIVLLEGVSEDRRHLYVCLARDSLRLRVSSHQVRLSQIPYSAPQYIYVLFVWIWEQTAIISLYSINLIVFIAETVCLLRGTEWIFIYNSHVFKAQWSLYVPSGLTFSKPTFYPHSIYVFCVDLRTNSVYFPIQH